MHSTATSKAGLYNGKEAVYHHAARQRVVRNEYPHSSEMDGPFLSSLQANSRRPRKGHLSRNAPSGGIRMMSLLHLEQAVLDYGSLPTEPIHAVSLFERTRGSPPCADLVKGFRLYPGQKPERKRKRQITFLHQDVI